MREARLSALAIACACASAVAVSRASAADGMERDHELRADAMADALSFLAMPLFSFGGYRKSHWMNAERFWARFAEREKAAAMMDGEEMRKLRDQVHRYPDLLEDLSRNEGEDGNSSALGMRFVLSPALWGDNKEIMPIPFRDMGQENAERRPVWLLAATPLAYGPENRFSYIFGALPLGIPVNGRRWLMNYRVFRVDAGRALAGPE